MRPLTAPAPWIAGAVLLGMLARTADAADAPGGKVPAAKRAIEPITPVLAGDVVGAMEEGKYKDAIAALEKLAADPKTTADDKAYYALIRGIAHRLAKEPDAARKALQAAIDASPKGRWVPKLRSELAATELAAGRFKEAEALARVEAESLLADDRKDALAEVYHAFARRLLKPDEPTTPADPEGAYALLTQARTLAKGDALRARLLLAMGRASQQAVNQPRAIQDFENYLKEYPKGEDRAAARFHLGEAQLLAGQPLPARLTWTDLARDLRKVDTKEAAEFRARSLYQVSRTFGIPAPPDDAQLNLGVAALRRLLEAYPSHPLSVRASYEIATSYLARGKSQQALSAFADFLKGDAFKAEADEARTELATLTMAAQFQVGQVLQGQEKFAEAIEAFRAYLAKFPNGPQSADAQRAVLETQLLIAEDFNRREKRDEARAAWRAFAAANPLDPRVPQLLFRIGESFEAQEKYDEAISAYETLAGKFPNTEPAAHAQFQVAAIYENHKGDLPEAIERFRKVAAVEPWHSQALQRVAVMEAKALAVVTPRAYRSGEAAKLRISSRNIETLTFTAYKLDPEAYFRKKLNVGGVESLDVGLVAPDAEWTAEVKGYAKYKPVEADYELDKKVKVPGVWVVKVTDEKTLQATTLVIGSDVDAIVKVSRDQLLVFVQDMKTGKGRAGARVLVAEGSGVVLEAKTGEDGVLLKAWDKPRDPNSPLHYLVLDGPDAAGSGLSVPGQVAQGLTARAYLYTDRPAYRPGQEVELRGVVREVKDGQYAADPGVKYKLEITDARGRLFVTREVTLSAFGTFQEQIPLDPGAPVGAYRVRLFRPGKSEFAGAFEVRAYQLQKIDLAFDFPRTVYFRGETIQGEVVAKYQYGTPLANRPITVNLPDGRILSGQTDAAGKFRVELPTEGFAEEQALPMVAQLPQDGVATRADLMLAVRAFRIDLSTTRDVYLAGESFSLDATTPDALGKPTGQTLTVSLLKRITQAGRITEREVAKETVKTDEATGKGSASLRVKDEDGGSFVVRAAGTDRFGNPVVAEKLLTISGKEDETKLRILADRQEFKVGETAKVNLHSRVKGGTALLTWEADRVLRYKLAEVKEGENAIAWEVDGAQFPNFTLTASRMADAKFHEARLDVRVLRELRVTISPKAPTVGPGGEVQVEVRTADQLGNPVAAEVSIALVDKALLRLHPDQLPPIDRFFYNQSRVGAFATESSVTFRYTPATQPVSQALVEDAERLAAEERDKAAEGVVRELAGVQLAMPAAAADAPALPAAAPMTPAQTEAKSVNGGFQSFGAMGGGGVAGPGDRLEVLAQAGEALDGEKKEFSDYTKAKDANLFARRSGKFDIDRKAGGRGAEAEPAQSRQRFVETAYWNPAVVTGKDGVGKVTFKAPLALSEYRFTARGVTGADTLVGQSTADLAVRKDFFVDLKQPAALTEGDSPRFTAQVHHTGVVGKVSVRLTVYAGGRERVMPKELDLKGDGVEEIQFDPFEVPDGDNVRLTLSAKAGDASDEEIVEIPIRPWGVQATASASGTSDDSTTAFVALPPGRAYEEPEMLVVVSPTLRRLLVELALGRDAYLLDGRMDRCFPIPPNTVADRAGDLLAAASALEYLSATRATDAPEARRLSDRVRGLVSELVTLQNDDGGWPWVAGEGPGNRPSDRLTSARVLWALATARPLGLAADPKVTDKAIAHLQGEFAKLDAGDLEGRASLLQALGAWGKATFEQANALNRDRQNLPDAALTYLALTFADLDRDALAGEILDILATRAKSEPVGPGLKDRRFWEGAKQKPWHRSPAETTALAALAFARVRPAAPELAGAIDWLLAHRVGTGWQPPKAKGPALAALSKFYGDAKAADDRYRLTVTVNDVEIYKEEVAGAVEGKAIRVPRRAIKDGEKNRVHFEIEGRGTFGYSATLTAFTRDFKPDQQQVNRPFVVHRRHYGPADPEFDGKVLPVGFGVAVNATGFENTVTQVPLGGRARIRIDAWRNQPAGQPAWDRDFLILEEHLPAGTTLVEGSVQSQAAYFELIDGVLTFYFTPDQYPGSIQYDVFGFLPGKYRALPTRLRSAYEPGNSHLGPVGELTVLPPGEASSDPYKATPDELYARGKALFDLDKLAEAGDPLESLHGGYTLRDDVLKDVARMLLLINIRVNDPAKIVKYFEVLKEKSPELVLPFDQIRVVGKAYLAIGEAERAYLVWRAIAEASYLEDAQVGEALRQRGKDLEAIAYLLDLWRRYPDSAPIRADFFGLSRLVAGTAARAAAEPAVRRQLAAAGLSRPELLLQAIRLTRAALAAAPRDPAADEEGLALVGDLLELGDFEPVVRLAERYATLYPKSAYLDSFQYSEALGRFHLGQYDRAIAVARRIAEARYKDASGAERESPNRWQALYILGQIHEARRQPGEALAYYRQVAERFTDAAGAVKALERKELKLPEVAVVRPGRPAAVAGGKEKEEGAGVGLRAVAPEDPRSKGAEASVKLEYRNVAEADVRVYPVDLMRLYLTRRSLDGIAGVDLAGIRPLLEKRVELGDGADYREKQRELALPLSKDGAYLVMARGGELYASGVVLVSPLELEVTEEPSAGRVRVAVREAGSREPASGVQVKVIGSDGGSFLSGATDLRGVFVAEGVRGKVTAVARRGADQYAFYRGTQYVGTPPQPNAPSAGQPAEAKPSADSQSLDANLRILNNDNQKSQIDRLQRRYGVEAQNKGVQVKDAR